MILCFYPPPFLYFYFSIIHKLKSGNKRERERESIWKKIVEESTYLILIGAIFFFLFFFLGLIFFFFFFFSFFMCVVADINLLLRLVFLFLSFLLFFCSLCLPFLHIFPWSHFSVSTLCEPKIKTLYIPFLAKTGHCTT